MIDSHCHLADEKFAADLSEVVGRAVAAGVVRAMVILSAGDAGESAAAVRVRALWPGIRVSVGVHPHSAGAFAGRPGQAAAALAKAVEDEGASAVGEIGLDYHYDFAFLSGGQTPEEATAHLSAINGYDLPWHVTFSYGRALQDASLKAWGGKAENVAAGQRAFAHRAEMNYLAAKGSWTKDSEKAA